MELSCTSLCGAAWGTVLRHLYLKPRMSRSKLKSSGAVAGTAKKYQAITIETAVKIIERVERDKKTADVVVVRTALSSLLGNKRS